MVYHLKLKFIGSIVETFIQRIFLSGYFITFLVRINHRGKASDWARNLGGGMQIPRLPAPPAQHRGFLPISCLELLLLSTMS